MTGLEHASIRGAHCERTAPVLPPPWHGVPGTRAHPTASTPPRTGRRRPTAAAAPSSSHPDDSGTRSVRTPSGAPAPSQRAAVRPAASLPSATAPHARTEQPARHDLADTVAAALDAGHVTPYMGHVVWAGRDRTTSTNMPRRPEGGTRA